MSQRPDPLIALEAAVEQIPPSECPRWLGELERVKAILWQRLLAAEHADCSREAADTPGRLLTIPQVAEILSIPESRAYELARQGQLRTVHIGKYIRVLEADLNQYVQRCR